MKWTYLALIAAAALGDANLAHAAKSNSNGSEEIRRGDYVAAEQLIDRQRAMFAWDSDLVLNLAVVYRRTGRPDQARALYQRLLRLPDEDVESGGRTMSVHMIAERALGEMRMVASR